VREDRRAGHYGVPQSLTFSESVLALTLVQQIDDKVEFRIRGGMIEASIRQLLRAQLADELAEHRRK